MLTLSIILSVLLATFSPAIAADRQTAQPDLSALKEVEKLMNMSGLQEMLSAFEPYNNCLMQKLGPSFLGDVQNFTQTIHKESKSLCNSGQRAEAQRFFDAAWEGFGKDEIGKISLQCYDAHLKGVSLGGFSEGMLTSNPLIARQLAAQSNRKPHICDQ